MTSIPYSDNVANRTQNVTGTAPADHDTGSVEQSLNVASADTKGFFTTLEKVAYGFAAFMMLAPLAAAAWGAHSN